MTFVKQLRGPTRLVAGAALLFALGSTTLAPLRAQAQEPPSAAAGMPQGALVTPPPLKPAAIDAYAPFNEAVFSRTFRHGTTAANGVKLHYVIGGRGPTVMLLNGAPETWFAYHKVMPALAQAGYTVIAVDVRGTGSSDKPAIGYDATTITNDLRALLRELKLQGPVNLVAYDITGRVGYAWAADHPSEIERLVLFETLIPGFGLEQAMNVATGGSYHFGFFANPDIAEFLVRGQEREYLRHLIDSSAADKAAISDETFDVFLKGWSQPSGTRGFFNHYKAFLGDSEPNRRRAARGLSQVPVLAMYGLGLGRDTAALPQTLQPLFARIEHEGVQGSGHFIQEERPGHFAGRLIQFFGQDRK
jgi:pimeloyl-ACP methyl ester carboxylesterase